jgi:hypothetical protein
MFLMSIYYLGIRTSIKEKLSGQEVVILFIEKRCDIFVVLWVSIFA